MRNIILGVTGSVAAIKTSELQQALKKIGNVQVVATKGGEYFINQIDHDYREDHDYRVWIDSDEWPEKYALGDPVLHIDLRRNASVLVIAPLDANTLAKIALGLCDNLLTCIVRAWDWNKPMILVPAMNTYMMEHRLTNKYLEELQQLGATIISPQIKKLACGDIGMGAMADIDEIFEITKTKLI